MSEPKLCKNCKHVDIRYSTFYDCKRPVFVDGFIPVSGKSEIRPINTQCSDERNAHAYRDTCGPEGKYFERRRTFWEWIQDVFNYLK